MPERIILTHSQFTFPPAFHFIGFFFFPSKKKIYQMKTTLKKLVHFPEQFTPEDAESAVNDIMKGSATPSQISAFLVSLKLQHKDKDPRIVAACANAMRSHARVVPYDGYEDLAGNVVDIVGTGGDGHNTYNVSTTASIVAAGAGAKVAKVRSTIYFLFFFSNDDK